MPLRPPPAFGTTMLPADTFRDDVVLITGGGTGLGKAMAVEFARAGAKIAVAGRSAQHLRQGIEAVEALGAKAFGVRLDVCDSDDVTRAFDEVEAAFGPVSILVNNAGINAFAAAEDVKPDNWRAITGTILDGTFFCSTEFARRRIKQGLGGAIVNSSVASVWTGGPGAAPGVAAKAGVENLTKTLAVEWAPDDIRVNAIVPGIFPHEDMLAHIASAGDVHNRARTIPGGRVGQAHELGWAATYLCSPFASFVTGAILVMDGASWLRRGVSMPEFTPLRDTIP